MEPLPAGYVDTGGRLQSIVAAPGGQAFGFAANGELWNYRDGVGWRNTRGGGRSLTIGTDVNVDAVAWLLGGDGGVWRYRSALGPHGRIPRLHHGREQRRGFRPGRQRRGLEVHQGGPVGGHRRGGDRDQRGVIAKLSNNSGSATATGGSGSIPPRQLIRGPIPMAGSIPAATSHRSRPPRMAACTASPPTGNCGATIPSGIGPTPGGRAASSPWGRFSRPDDVWLLNAAGWASKYVDRFPEGRWTDTPGNLSSIVTARRRTSGPGSSAWPATGRSGRTRTVSGGEHPREGAVAQHGLVPRVPFKPSTVNSGWWTRPAECSATARQSGGMTGVRLLTQKTQSRGARPAPLADRSPAGFWSGHPVTWDGLRAGPGPPACSWHRRKRRSPTGRSPTPGGNGRRGEFAP